MFTFTRKYHLFIYTCLRELVPPWRPLGNKCHETGMPTVFCAQHLDCILNSRRMQQHIFQKPTGYLHMLCKIDIDSSNCRMLWDTDNLGTKIGRKARNVFQGFDKLAQVSPGNIQPLKCQTWNTNSCRLKESNT